MIYILQFFRKYLLFSTIGVIILKIVQKHRCVAQLGRALRSGRRGRKFESCISDCHKDCNDTIVAVLYFISAQLELKDRSESH